MSPSGGARIECAEEETLQRDRPLRLERFQHRGRLGRTPVEEGTEPPRRQPEFAGEDAAHVAEVRESVVECDGDEVVVSPQEFSGHGECAPTLAVPRGRAAEALAEESGERDGMDAFHACERVHVGRRARSFEGSTDPMPAGGGRSSERVSVGTRLVGSVPPQALAPRRMWVCCLPLEPATDCDELRFHRRAGLQTKRACETQAEERTRSIVSPAPVDQPIRTDADPAEGHVREDDGEDRGSVGAEPVPVDELR